MRRALVIALAASFLFASVPMEVFAQVRVVLPSNTPSGAGAMSGAVPVLPNFHVSLPLSSIAGLSLSQSISPSLSAPSIYPPSVAAAVSVIPHGQPATTQALYLKTPAPRANPLLPQAVLTQAAAHLTAASAPDKPVLDGKKAGDEVFSGETSRAPSDETPVPGKVSESP